MSHKTYKNFTWKEFASHVLGGNIVRSGNPVYTTKGTPNIHDHMVFKDPDTAEICDFTFALPQLPASAIMTTPTTDGNGSGGGSGGGGGGGNGGGDGNGVQQKNTFFVFVDIFGNLQTDRMGDGGQGDQILEVFDVLKSKYVEELDASSQRKEILSFIGKEYETLVSVPGSRNREKKYIKVENLADCVEDAYKIPTLPDGPNKGELDDTKSPTIQTKIWMSPLTAEVVKKLKPDSFVHKEENALIYTKTYDCRRNRKNKKPIMNPTFFNQFFYKKGGRYPQRRLLTEVVCKAPKMWWSKGKEKGRFVFAISSWSIYFSETIKKGPVLTPEQEMEKIAEVLKAAAAFGFGNDAAEEEEDDIADEGVEDIDDEEQYESSTAVKRNYSAMSSNSGGGGYIEPPSKKSRTASKKTSTLPDQHEQKDAADDDDIDFEDAQSF